MTIDVFGAAIVPGQGCAPTLADGGASHYARFWRWHFYAAFLVIPFVLWQGITGVIYLWSDDFADWRWPQMRFVEVQPQQASLDVQLDAAMRSIDSTALPTTIRTDQRANRSTTFLFAQDNGLITPVFVNPYSGKTLGHIDAQAWLPGLTRALHGGWPLGKPGSWLLELGACWAMVMVLTGIYLWWPRGSAGLAGVLYPRLRAHRRVFWRDLHSVVGFWFSGIFLLFLLTAMPWTDFWGNQILRPLQRWSAQLAPAPAPLPGNREITHDANDARALNLSLIFAHARQLGMTGTLEISLHPTGPVTARMKQARAAGERSVLFDRASGAAFAQSTWSQLPLLPKVIATGVDLHEGTFFGRANQWLNTLMVAALLWLSGTGLIGWYKRRPKTRTLSPPPRARVPATRTIIIAVITMSVIFPLFGLSVLLCAGAEQLFHLKSRTRHLA
jgi:uncharacterized iron-regulated membrane protein